MRRVRSIHFVGIGGAGMCGVAEVLLNQGYAVSGSDLVRSAATERLVRGGANVRLGHAAAAVADADVVVVSSAVPANNVEVARARELRIPVIPRAEMLGELMRHRHGIAVAGTHGKTTTASMIASIFQAAGLDPTFVIGGVVASEGGNARLGAGRHLIAEADESDASFLHLQPLLAVITNIDRDHLDAYGQDYASLTQAFVDFAHRLPFYGTLVICADDPGAAAMATAAGRPLCSYGFSASADYRAAEVRIADGAWRFTARRPGAVALPIAVPLPGCHNVRNALAAVAVATEEGIADGDIVAGLAGFRGVGRRFETDECILAERRITLVDDYGHHPTEVAHVIDTVRRIWPGRRLAMVYQPHRYTRTRDLLDDFATVLARVDVLLLGDVYGAGEAPIAGADSRSLAAAIADRGAPAPRMAATPAAALATLPEIVADGDVLAIQGAGDISQLAAAVRGRT